jgi:chromate transport protein ChrA
MQVPLLAGDGPLAKVRPVRAFIVVIGVFTAGVLIGGVPGALLLGLLAVGVGVLLATTWRVLKSTDRVVRVAVLLILIGIAVTLLR